MKFITLSRQLSTICNRLAKIKTTIQGLELDSDTLPPEHKNQLELLSDETDKKHSEFEISLSKLFENETLPDDYDENKLCELQDTISDLYIDIQILVKKYLGKSCKTQTRPTLNPDTTVLSAQSSELVNNTLGLHSTPSNSNRNSSLKLPPLSLKTFNGSPEQWLSYVSLFQVSVHENESISKVERFQYLLSTLQGEPFSLVKNLPITAENYDVAWDLLQRRYQNSRKIISIHINNIMDLPNIPDISLKNLRSFISQYKENAQALLVLNHDVAKDNILLSAMLLRKLHPDIRKKFESSRLKSQDVPSVDEVITFLENECGYLEAANFSNSQFHKVGQSISNHSQSNKKPNPNPTHTGSNKFSSNQNRAVLLSSRDLKASCMFCNKADHNIYHCADFKNLSVQERYNFVKKTHLCLNCFGTSHSVKDCKSHNTCFHCKGKHHSLLHITSNHDKSNSKLKSSVQNSQLDKASPSEPENQQDPPFVAVSSNSQTTILLATALVNLKSASGNTVVARAVIDSASMVSCLTENVANLLLLKRAYSSNSKLDGLSSVEVKPKGVSKVDISTLSGEIVANDHSVVILERITSNLPHSEVPGNIKDYFKNVVLADPTFHVPSRIDMLIGADLFTKIVTGDRIILNKDLPAAMNSVFGYLIIGPTPTLSSVTVTPPDSGQYSGIVSLLSTQDIDLHNSLQAFWALEEPPQKSHITSEEKVCENHFLNTFSRNPDGRYSVRLPVKENHPPLGDSSTCARNRFFSLERKMQNDPKLKAEYTKTINDCLLSEHMEPAIPPPINDGKHFYLPHHAVVKEDSSTTKLRIVYDASARSTSGVSLNEILHTGPKLHNDLNDVLLKFRFSPIVFSCDIKQMFRQIMIHPDDRNYQMMYWREDKDMPLSVYRLTTVVFGFNCSPYLALRTLRQLIKDEGVNYPLAAEALNKQVYVDDLILTAQTTEEALVLKHEAEQLLLSGGFELRKWTSNCPQLMETLPETHKETPLFFNSSDQPFFKVLGIKWSPNSDSFSYQLNIPEAPPTKRGILGTVSKIFDPCGWLTPVTLWVKALIQVLWVSGLSWDDHVPPDINEKWQKFMKQLPLLSEVNLPRYVSLSDAVHISLHGFCDGSETGYGACVYLRCVHSLGEINVHLLIAKARVAPLKKISIPRLELCGAHLLAKLLNYCNTLISQNYLVNETHAWCDSSVVLSWIQTVPYRLKVYVANRISEVQELTPTHIWKHVSTHSNPADFASRGTLPLSLKDNNLWWNGPDWLSLDSGLWPIPRVFPLNNTVLPELKSEPLHVLTTTTEPDFLLKFSSWNKTQRVMCYVLRFIDRLKKKSKATGTLKTSELTKATKVICKIAQQSRFQQDLSLLKLGKPCSVRLQRLSPFLDEDGLIRVGGRNSHSDQPYSAKHPILLAKCHITNLLIDHYHLKYLHAGPVFLQAVISQMFWIISSRVLLRQRVFKCMKCFHSKPRLADQKMGDLPASRLQAVRPFYNCGTDYAGPFLVKPHSLRKIPVVKVYLCLFICFATKAIHIEVVTSLSAEAYIAALTRFVSRRGLCANIFSDCGSNYVGASHSLKKIIKQFLQQDGVRKELDSFATQQNINFHFIPPAAPHQGGLWERAVRSIKHHLTRVVGNQILTLEEFTTLTTRIEAILNSRPLTPMSIDPSDIDCLTPGHFIIGAPLLGIPEENWKDIPNNRLNRWQLLQALTQSIWRRWNKEYLYTLQQRSKWLCPQANISVGELVLIHDPDLPPLRWKMGRILNTFPGKDGLVRSVEILTKTGKLTRPITKISPLPIEV